MAKTLNGFLQAGGFATYLKIRFVFYQLVEATPHQRVIVNNEYVYLSHGRFVRSRFLPPV